MIPGKRDYLWCVPHVAMIAAYTVVSFSGPKTPQFAVNVAFIGLALVPALVPLVAAVVDGRAKILVVLLVATWLGMGSLLVVVPRSSHHNWMQHGIVDMSPMLLPLVALYYLACSAVAGLAFYVAGKIRRRRAEALPAADA
ncbi:MAG: hypothetical protein ACOCVR_00905 [Myxococcota bacterium]